MVIDHVTFRVRHGREREFEAQHAEWLRALRRSRGFVAEILMRNADDPAEYRAEIRWASRDYRDRFAAHADPETRALLDHSAALLESAPAHCLLEVV